MFRLAGVIVWLVIGRVVRHNGGSPPAIVKCVIRRGMPGYGEVRWAVVGRGKTQQDNLLSFLRINMEKPVNETSTNHRRS